MVKNMSSVSSPDLQNIARILDASTLTEVSMLSVVLNLIFTLVGAIVLRYFYINFSRSFTNKKVIGDVIPLLAIITFLVIMIVKSSLALSLGLVGALSIIRFRTPVKDPEDLVYLFFAISIGLGMGANQALLTFLVFTLLLGFQFVFLKRESSSGSEMVLVNLEVDEHLEPHKLLEQVQEFMMIKFPRTELKRLDVTKNSFHSIFAIDSSQVTDLPSKIRELLEFDSEIVISVVDMTSSNPS